MKSHRHPLKGFVQVIPHIKDYLIQEKDIITMFLSHKGKVSSMDGIAKGEKEDFELFQ